jgi:hypothetical protein
LTPKKVSVSLYQQILHEFRTAIRRAQSEGISRQEIERNISVLIAESSKDLTKMTAGLLLLAISVENLKQGDLLTVKTSLIEISIPAVYGACLGSIFWFGLIVACINQSQYLSAKVVSEYLFHKWRRFAGAEWALTGSTYFDVASPHRNGHFFKIKQPYLITLNFLFFLAFMILTVPVIGSAWSILAIATGEISSASSAYLGKSLAVSTIALVVLPVLYLVAYFVPFPIRKNESTIRWNFLINLVWGPKRLHPQANRWHGKQR